MGGGGERRNCSGAEKMAILREHLIENVPISKVCEKHGLQPTVFYGWQKRLLAEGGAPNEVASMSESQSGPGFPLNCRVLGGEYNPRNVRSAHLLETGVYRVGGLDRPCHAGLGSRAHCPAGQSPFRAADLRSQKRHLEDGAGSGGGHRGG